MGKKVEAWVVVCRGELTDFYADEDHAIEAAQDSGLDPMAHAVHLVPAASEAEVRELRKVYRAAKALIRAQELDDGTPRTGDGSRKMGALVDVLNSVARSLRPHNKKKVTR